MVDVMGGWYDVDMVADENDSSGIGMGEMVPRHHSMPHYHGDAVRALFVIGAILIVVAQSTGADLPLSTAGAVVSAILLVIAAGITNPATGWIHWVNSLFAVLGTLVFGMAAIERYRSGVSAFAPSFFYIEGITILSLFAIYFTTRTIRGIFLRIKH